MFHPKHMLQCFIFYALATRMEWRQRLPWRAGKSWTTFAESPKPDKPVPGHSACPEVSAKGGNSDAEDVGSLQTRMGSLQRVSDAAGWCSGAKRGTLGFLNSNSSESPALPWGGALGIDLGWSSRHQPLPKATSIHCSLLPHFHAKVQWGLAAGCSSNSSFPSQLQL